MGKANTQIATRDNVNSKRLGAFVTSTIGGTYLKKCVTRKAVTDIEYLAATNRTNTSKILFYANDYGSYDQRQNIMTVTRSSTSSGNHYINSENIYIYRNTYNQQSVAYVNIPFSSYNSVSTSVTLTSNWPNSGDTSNYENVALFSQRLTNVPTNNIITINYEGTINGNTCDMIFSNGIGNVSSVPAYSGKIIMGIVVTDDTGYVIASKSPSTISSYYTSGSFSFSSTNSTINIYFIFPEINVVFYPSSQEYYTGLDVTFAAEMEYYESYYDQTYKCVQYQDINRIGGTFPCMYYIYNNKSSNAKLDYVKARVSLTSTVGQGTWTDIGNVSIGTVDSTTSGTITCTLPASIDLSKQYYFYVECGYTNNNQQWYGGWGTGGANSNASTYCGKQTWGYTPVVPLNSVTGGAAVKNVLNYCYISSATGSMWPGLQGRTSTRTALFRIE